MSMYQKEKKNMYPLHSKHYVALDWLKSRDDNVL